MTTNIDASVDRDAIAAAEGVLAAAEGRLRAARTDAENVDAQAAAVRRELPELLKRAKAGEPVTVAMVADIHTRARDLTDFATFQAAVARELEEPVSVAKAALADVRHAAWWPVMLRGQDLRIEAAMKADRARLMGQWGMSTPPVEVAAREAAKSSALAAAKPIFDQGTELVRLAWQNGVRFKSSAAFHQPEWPAREAGEREYWSRPFTAEDAARALA